MARHIELIHRSAVVQHLQKLDFGGAQVDDRRFDLRFVLHAQQLDAIEVDLRDVAGLEAGAANVDDLVVVVEVRLCQIENELGLRASPQTPCAGQTPCYGPGPHAAIG